MSAPVRWYAVGVVVRPGKTPGAPKYDTIYLRAPRTTPLTRAQIQALHADEGGVPTFRTTAPPWERPPKPPSLTYSAPPDGEGALAVAGAAGAIAGGLWAVFAAVLPFCFLSC